MTRKETEDKLRKAANNCTPDLRDAILKKCSESPSDNTIYIGAPVKRRRENMFKVLSIAVIVLMASGILLNMLSVSMKNRVAVTVDIDVNPSLELNINNDDKIVSVTAINEDAVAILDGMQLEGVQTKVAVNAIIGSMFEHGYLLGETDTVLVSVDGKDKNKTLCVEQNVSRDIDSMLKACNPDSRVISQSVGDINPEIAAMVNDYGISKGKATLIYKIIGISDVYSVDELLSLNITELNETICSIDDMESLEIKIHNSSSSEESVSAGEAEAVINNEDTTVSEENMVSENSNSGNPDDSEGVGTEKSDVEESDNKDSDTDNDKAEPEGKPDNGKKDSVSDNDSKSNKNKKDKDKDKDKKKDKDKDKKDGDDGSASDNSVPEESASDNSASDNSASENSASENAVSENSASENSASENSASENSASDNTAL